MPIQPLRPVTNIAIACCDMYARTSFSALIASLVGYQVLLEADSCPSLVEALTAAITLPAVCILDTDNGRAECLKTIRKIKTTWPGIKVLIAIPFIDPQALKVYKNIPDGILLKNEDRGKLKKDLDNIVFNGNHYAATIAEEAQNSINNPGLTVRQTEFLKLCCSQWTYQEIATKMKVSVRTVDGHREALFRQFSVTSRTGLVLYALKHRLVLINDISLE